MPSPSPRPAPGPLVIPSDCMGHYGGTEGTEQVRMVSLSVPPCLRGERERLTLEELGAAGRPARMIRADRCTVKRAHGNPPCDGPRQLRLFSRPALVIDISLTR